jgi:hypothetical protein
MEMLAATETEVGMAMPVEMAAPEARATAAAMGTRAMGVADPIRVRVTPQARETHRREPIHPIKAQETLDHPRRRHP